MEKITIVPFKKENELAHFIAEKMNELISKINELETSKELNYRVDEFLDRLNPRHVENYFATERAKNELLRLSREITAIKQRHEFEDVINSAKKDDLKNIGNNGLINELIDVFNRHNIDSFEGSFMLHHEFDKNYWTIENVKACISNKNKHTIQ